ncbi:MAG: TetR/AcrR family transcriptional regulator [Clostridia bacterium]|nr:TetR/AcrR family transcriptional regulator [Clostridia bacterium]
MHKGDMKKQAILDTAEKLFFEKGYRDTSVQDVLDRLHCSKGSFYHHYESKLQVLMEICRQKAKKSFEAYQETEYKTELDKLNGLIYQAMPFNKEGEDMLAVLLPLEGLSDGQMVLQSVIDAQKEYFYPEMEALLAALRAQNVMHYYQESLPALLWDTYTACYGKLMQEAAALKNGGTTQNVIQIIEAARFMWERLTDAPFGSLELIRADEALQCINHAILRIRRMESEQNVQPAEEQETEE